MTRLKNIPYRTTLLITSCLVAVAACGTARAADPGDQADEQVIVTGTRDPHQTARQSVSPIQVVTAAQLAATGQADIRDALIQLAPSMTRSDMNFGNANMTDAISLRGLTPNQTLVLVNGKRRHTTADLSTFHGPQQGTTPVDIDMIPVSAVDHVEILQDGAAAQYGSDAIAGVVNIILKKSDHGLSVQSINGGYEAGDGFTSGESANWGTKLGDRGYFNLSGEVKYNDYTNRSGVDTQTGKYDNAILGMPEQLRETLAYNMAYRVTNDIELYSFGTYGHRNGSSMQNFRTGAVIPSMYPDGFEPRITLDENDFGVTTGFRGSVVGWDWDVSTTYGADYDRSGTNHTGNPSLVSEFGSSPTHFDNMETISDTEWTTDAGVRRSFRLPVLAAPVNVALGAQYRYDTYRIGAGEFGSWYGAGPAAMHGLNSQNASDSGRDVTAGYVDVSTRLLPKWQIDLAGRFEHYTDAGDTETGKVSSRYDFNKYFGLRGTVGNGFRAPTLAEENWSSVSASPTGASGILPVNSIAARALGSRPLKPERSTNFSAGFVLNPTRNLHITLDAYQIDLRDRIMLGGSFNGQTAIDALMMQGVGLQANVNPKAVSASYFSNAASTRTQGMDIIASYQTDLGGLGHVIWDLAANFNETQVRRNDLDALGRPLLNEQQIGYISTYTPRNKVVFGGNWSYGKWTFSVHEIRYGHATSELTYYTGPHANSVSQFQRFVNTPRFATNLLVAYQIDPSWRVALGANNVGNAKQRLLPPGFRYLGAERYDYDIQQIGFNGGYYYFQVNLTL
jgi:iron complex outermembrane recepter protein